MKNNSKLKKILIPSIVGVIAVVLIVVIVAVSGGNKTNKTYFDNEKDKLVFSTAEVDKVFNPFFSTSGPDGNVVGLTQIGMIGNDSKGEPVYGDDEAVVAKDLQIVTENANTEEETTTYYFVLKNNVRFSNGSLLTIKDVLFNLYVYLDPLYTGSSTIYSTDIIGLNEYRFQVADENEQQQFKEKFQTIAYTRIDGLVGAATQIFKDHSDEVVTQEKFVEYLAEWVPIGEAYTHVVEDYNKAIELFKEELEQDYRDSIDTFEDIVFTDENKKVYKNLLTTDVEAFLYNEGYITWNKKDAKLESSLVLVPSELKNWTKEQAINTVYADMVPGNIDEIVTGWKTANELNTFLVNQAMEEYYKNTDRKYKNIEGIKFANMNEKVTVNGVTYDQPQYDENGDIKENSNEVLSITIKKVDPKAIWNFSFAIAPMYYYSDQEHIDKFDFVENFGVEYGSQEFLEKVVKNKDKLGVPVGAGPYAASKSDGGFENVREGDFYSLGVIYFERNPYYIMGPAKIKYVRYQVVPAAQMLNTLYERSVDFIEPNAKPETIRDLEGQKANGFGHKSIRTAGYGYIGINAGKVPDIAVRQAIMHSINTQECVDYYETTATPIYRPMSKESWAYPGSTYKNDPAPTPYYPFIGGKVPEDLTVVNPDYADYIQEIGAATGSTLTKEQQDAFLVRLVEGAGYTLNSAGVYYKGNHTLKYTFTIAGQETDHPAWQALSHSREILNRVGFDITVTTDSNALKKLNNGDLTVWAAAWGSTIDPDMYQVYHKDSKATSTLNWGYKQIFRDTTKYELEALLIEDLSQLIEDARHTNNREKRAHIYAKALDIVMQLAIELPTYQRDDLYAFNTNKIDVSTFTPENELSAFKGLTSEIHNVSLNVIK